MYVTLSVVVNGVEEETQVIYDYLILEDVLTHLEEEAKGDGIDMDVYAIWHDHMEGDCECVQFLTDHHPFKSFHFSPRYV